MSKSSSIPMICYACQKEINELPYYYAVYFEVKTRPDVINPEKFIEKRYWCEECGK